MKTSGLRKKYKRKKEKKTLMDLTIKGSEDAAKIIKTIEKKKK